MKKLLLLLSVMLLSLTANAQFTLTPTGLKSTTDVEKNYIVIEADGKLAPDLFSSTLVYIGKTFVSPKDVVSKVDGKMISLNAIIPECVDRTKMHSGWDLNTTIVIEFKDNKVKINAPLINSISINSSSVGLQEMFVQKATLGMLSGGKEFSIFDKKGKLKIELAKETVEIALNTIIKEITEQLTVSTNDEW